MGKRIDLVGRVFGRLTVLEYADDKYGHATWFCECSCNPGVLLKPILGYNLRRGSTKSCGCLNKEKIRLIQYARCKGKPATNRNDEELKDNKNKITMIIKNWEKILKDQQ